MRIYLKTAGSHLPKIMEVETLPRVGDSLGPRLQVIHVRPPQANANGERLPIVTCKTARAAVSRD